MVCGLLSCVVVVMVQWLLLCYEGGVVDVYKSGGVVVLECWSVGVMMQWL